MYLAILAVIGAPFFFSVDSCERSSYLAFTDALRENEKARALLGAPLTIIRRTGCVRLYWPYKDGELAEYTVWVKGPKGVRAADAVVEVRRGVTALKFAQLHGEGWLFESGSPTLLFGDPNTKRPECNDTP